MVNWHSTQPLYERKAYRIVIKHLTQIFKDIPVITMSLNNYKEVLEANITDRKIYFMYKDIYETIGLDYGNLINKDIEKVTKANSLFNTNLLKEILLFLSNEGGVRIKSVRNTLIEDIVKSIRESLLLNDTVIGLQNAIYSIIGKPAQFYKWQALRIARTETTTASNYAAMKTAEMSDLIVDKIWISIQDNRTRITPFDHLDMNNVLQALKTPFFVGGEEIQFPGDSHASAGNVINCRCTVAFVPKRDADGMLIIKTNM